MVTHAFKMLQKILFALLFDANQNKVMFNSVQIVIK